jgi:TonB-linked SusC/RagA family outer membrane protein
MKKFTFLLFYLLCAASVFAQSRVVSGHVSDTTGKGLAGVSVKVSGTNTGTFTNENGDFTIKVSTTNPTLVFSYVNYEPKTVTLQNDSKNVSVVLKQVQNNLSDVEVTVGYGKVRRSNLTGAVSIVSSKDLKDIPINSAEDALAGRLAGVQVTSSEGSPDAEVNIVTRGGGSITQNNAPLYVVDGMIVDNALSTLSPQDIENITVLKDASETAIYGARGANGVVIITTKRGEVGKSVVSFNGFVGVQQVTKTLPVLSPYDYVMYQYEKDFGVTPPNTTQQSNFTNQFGSFQDIDLYKNAPFVNWQQQVFGRNAVMTTDNVSVSGGNAKTQFNLSLTENATQAVMLASNYNRQLLNFRLNHQVSNFLRVGFNARFNNQVVEGQGTSNPGSSGANFLRQAVRYQPYLSPGQSLEYYDPDMADNTNGGGLYLVNPLLLIQSQYRRAYQTRLGFDGFAELKLAKFLSFRSTAGYDLYPTTNKNYDDSLTYNSRLSGSGMPIATIINSKIVTIDNSNVFTFSNSALKGRFNEHNKINWIVGEEVYQTQIDSSNITQRYFPNGTPAAQALADLSLASPPAGSAQLSPTTNSLETRIWSFFTRLNYAYDDKYLATFSMRADGSTVFAPGKQWGYFPAGSLAWRISQEKFMQSLKPVISDAKLRVSYGEAGNNRIPPFLYLTQFVTNGNYYGLNNQLHTAFAPAALTNSDLTWETTVSRDVGADISFLHDRILLSADYYRNKTKNLLINVAVPGSSGYTTQFQNVGATSNNGYEIQLTAIPIQTKKFNWTISFNISGNVNKVLSLGSQENSFFVSSGWAGSANPPDYIVKVGAPVGSMYGLVNDGFYKISDFDYNDGVYTLKAGVPNDQNVTGVAPQPGIIKFKDLNGDGIVSLDSDRTIIGNANPKFFGGINQQSIWQSFDASIFINFQYGNNIANDNKLEFTSGYTNYANMLAIEKNRWRTVDPTTGQIVTDPTALAALNAHATLPQPLTNSNSWLPQSWAIENGSFIRINNITIGYSLPQEVVRKIHLQRFRVYVTANNLAVITNYSGYDPEVNTRRATPMTPGVDYSAYPRARSYIFGLNVVF